MGAVYDRAQTLVSRIIDDYNRDEIAIPKPEVIMICPECEAEYRSGFTVCSDCNVALVDKLPPEDDSEPEVANTAEDDETALQDNAVFNPITCPRCEQELDYVGTKSFHEGSNWGVFGEVGELFVKREKFDVYVCPNCGRVEFFVSGIGEQYREQR